MHAHIITLFPEIFKTHFWTSIMKWAWEKKLFTLHFYYLPDFCKKNRVDDRPYGGGPGTVLSIEPIYTAITHIEENFWKMEKIFLAPQGKTLHQKDLEKWNTKKINHILFLCGHYEWVDQRIFEIFNFNIYSLGDYILSSGELATSVFLDGMLRLQEGVLGNSNSLKEESFSDSLEWKKEYPQYTRPEEFLWKKVPHTLMSWNHKKISQWKKNNRR